MLEVLQTGTVQALLLHDDPADERLAWFGPQPLHLGLDEATLRAMGVEAPMQGRLVDVAIRAAFGSAAEVRVVPKAVVKDGLGAILRHTGTRPS